jgi:hypothetical protein
VRFEIPPHAFANQVDARTGPTSSLAELGTNT